MVKASLASVMATMTLPACMEVASFVVVSVVPP